MPAQNLSLTAQWEPTNFIITLNANGNTSTWPYISSSFSGGQLTASVEVRYGQPYPTIPAPTAAGYTFKNWYDGTAGTHFPDGVQIAGNVAVASARTFWAQWTANTYIVTFNPTGGTVSPTSKSVTYG